MKWIPAWAMSFIHCRDYLMFFQYANFVYMMCGTVHFACAYEICSCRLYLRDMIETEVGKLIWWNWGMLSTVSGMQSHLQFSSFWWTSMIIEVEAGSLDSVSTVLLSKAPLPLISIVIFVYSFSVFWGFWCAIFMLFCLIWCADVEWLWRWVHKFLLFLALKLRYLPLQINHNWVNQSPKFMLWWQLVNLICYANMQCHL